VHCKNSVRLGKKHLARPSWANVTCEAVEADVEEMDLVGLECLGGMGNTISFSS
jgi:hypothetical protein